MSYQNRMVHLYQIYLAKITNLTYSPLLNYILLRLLSLFKQQYPTLLNNIWSGILPSKLDNVPIIIPLSLSKYFFISYIVLSIYYSLDI